MKAPLIGLSLTSPWPCVEASCENLQWQSLCQISFVVACVWCSSLAPACLGRQSTQADLGCSLPELNLRLRKNWLEPCFVRSKAGCSKSKTRPNLRLLAVGHSAAVSTASLKGHRCFPTACSGCSWRATGVWSSKNRSSCHTAAQKCRVVGWQPHP